MRILGRLTPLFAIGLAALIAMPPGADAQDAEAVRGGYLQHTSGTAVPQSFQDGWFLTADPAPRGIESGDLALGAVPDGVESLRGRYVRVTGQLVDDRLPPLPAASLTVATLRGAADPGLADAIEIDLALRGLDFDDDGRPTPSGAIDSEGRCRNGELADVVPLEMEFPFSADMFRAVALVCPKRGQYWALRTGGFAGSVHWIGPLPIPPTPLRQVLRADLDARDISYAGDGTAEPQGGLSPDGSTCEDGSATIQVTLVAAPLGGADFTTLDAFVCPSRASYWARETGGFAGGPYWVGPFELPEPPQAADLAPEPVRVIPARVRVRRRAYTRRLKICMASGIVPDDLAPADIQIGLGIEVRRVLRPRRGKVRLVARIRPDAPIGRHTVSIRDVQGAATLEVRGRRGRR